MSPARELISSGVPGLDTLLGGGVPAQQSIALTGEPGCGKTVLAMQVAFAQAAAGFSTVVATVTSETTDKLAEDLAGFAFYRRERLGEEVLFLSIYPALKKGGKDARDLILSTVRDRKARLLIIDGLRAVRDLWQDEARVRDFLYDLNVGLAAAGCTFLFTAEYSLQKLMELPEATTVDGIISLSRFRRGAVTMRQCEVVKLRGRRHLSGRHTMRIGDSGVEVIPRPESAPRCDREFRPSGERAAFGLPELDALVCGGLPRQTTTLLAGGTGIGKSLLSLHFAAQGARNGELAVYYSFSEPAGSLVARARSIGLELEPLLREGRLHIEYPPPPEADADEVAEHILELLRARGGRRLVVDNLADFEAAVADRERVRPFFAALIAKLRAAAVTSIFTKQISKLMGPELDFSDTPTAAFAENLIFLRNVELKGGLHRVVSIVNLRDSAFDGSLREFTLSHNGLRVLDRLHAAEGLLTGLARPIGTFAKWGDQP